MLWGSIKLNDFLSLVLYEREFCISPARRASWVSGRVALRGRHGQLGQLRVGQLSRAVNVTMTCTDQLMLIVM